MYAYALLLDQLFLWTDSQSINHNIISRRLLRSILADFKGESAARCSANKKCGPRPPQQDMSPMFLGGPPRGIFPTQFASSDTILKWAADASPLHGRSPALIRGRHWRRERKKNPRGNNAPS
mmetsp:Transcript_33953/g.68391  ORF Transcript_33953/g.68391 Transcript_33953/m.68391 type:complete len:122 (+) Transcript_33953:1446-1811(+)